MKTIQIAVNALLVLSVLPAGAASVWIVWRNLRLSMRGLPKQPAPAWMELLYQSVYWLAFLAIPANEAVRFAPPHDFGTLFVFAVVGFCALLSALVRRAEKKKDFLAPGS